MISFDIQTFSLPLPEPYKSQTRKLAKLAFTELSQLSVQEKEEHDDRYCSQNNWCTFIFAIEGDTVIGSVTTLKRNLSVDGRDILLGGIGGVATHPERGNQGVASALLKVAMDELKQTGCDIAYLGTDIEDPAKTHLYQKFGFQVLKSNVTYLGKSGRRYIQDGAMIAPINSKSLFATIMESNQPFDIGVGDW